ncbi:magnesium-transporting ATPase (P-type) [Azospirillum fermentarium]|uniref:cation-translocating P-type ATPase n=1 Tax=Azospirillum fermentarium TaxID=1233114 RepID=UPI0022278628|nr:HAD-IC family P-type ATPase [Azospirillum fermentarium]MCW2245067.1 magnesium-transporting ATPase (P-type) [Azospirillum fermentarium]
MDDARPHSAPHPHPWHARDPDETAGHLDSPRHGLDSAEAAARLDRHGPNRLTPPPKRPGWKRLLSQFDNALIYVLLAAGAVALALGETADAAVIAGVVVINAVIGYVQEGKAEQALDAIRAMLSPQAAVLRGGRPCTIPAEELVPGDRVLLASGDRVPADLRLVHAKGLRVQEAALTGESVPVSKTVAPVAPDAPLGDRTSMAFSGTLVTEGQGQGIVVATGDHTELGRVGRMLAKVESLTTPLLAQMDRFGRLLTVAILGVTVAVFAFGALVQGEPWVDMVMAAVALAVAAIPEGLPAVMTITLAIGVTRMARRNAIIRRLPAVETLGSVGVICSDKTGTLTRNELTVQAAVTPAVSYEVEGIGYAPEGRVCSAGQPAENDGALTELARAALLCNDAGLSRGEDGAWCVTGDPTDGALLVFARKAGLDPARETAALPRHDTIPFESERGWMAVLQRVVADGGGILYVKGAPERILPHCSGIDPAAWAGRVETMAAQGLRVLALARRTHPTCPAEADGIGDGLEFLGLCGLIDPPREEARAAVAECRRAGIAVKMITGDHAATAVAIARRFGLAEDGRVLTGADLDRLDDAGLQDAALDTDVFARTAPEHKLRLVTALQAGGLTVAMTGDGVNDAPALKRADVGVSMGIMGTEAAKEAADMVLADDNFASIAHAVEEGRTVYANLRKTILFLLPTNGGQALVILAAVLAGGTLPITPVQILWINMVTAVTLGLALAFEPAEPGIMAQPPRPPREPILPLPWAGYMAVVAGLLVAASYGLFLYHQGEGAEVARTVAVNALVAGEIGFLFNARTGLGPVWRGTRPGRAAWISAGLIVGLQAAFTHAPPLQALFGTTGLRADDWLTTAAAGVAVFLLAEAAKPLFRRA